MLEQYNITPAVKHFAVFGNPVKHSKSPQIHQLFAQQFDIPLRYEAIQVDSGCLEEAVREFAKLGGQGLNITVPYKEEAFQIAAHLTERARVCQSVNTLSFDEELQIYGDTTDGQGLINDLVINNDVELKDTSVLVMGAGGTVRAILQPLLQQKPEVLTIVNRTVSRAQSLAIQFSNEGVVSACSYDDLKRQRFDIIINATTLSLQGEVPPLPDGLLKADACCYDLMYADTDTTFMQWAKKQGARIVLDGLGMLVEQAAESFSIWHGVKPDTQPVLDTLRGA